MARDQRRLGREPHKLRPGRHGLSRSFVARNQRERILAAVADAISAKGYPRTSVEDIIACAGVSRRTFYDMFDNKEHAFLAAYEEGARRLVISVERAQAEEVDFAAREIAGLRAFLELLAASPSFARMCVVEVLAAGPSAISRRNRTMAAFAAMIKDAARELPGPPPSEVTTEMLVGGVYDAVHKRILREQTNELPALLPDLVHTTLLPYLGQETADAARETLLAEAAAAPPQSG